MLKRHKFGHNDQIDADFVIDVLRKALPSSYEFSKKTQLGTPVVVCQKNTFVSVGIRILHQPEKGRTVLAPWGYINLNFVSLLVLFALAFCLVIPALIYKYALYYVALKEVNGAIEANREWIGDPVGFEV